MQPYSIKITNKTRGTKYAPHPLKIVLRVKRYPIRFKFGWQSKYIEQTTVYMAINYWFANWINTKKLRNQFILEQPLTFGQIENPYYIFSLYHWTVSRYTNLVDSQNTIPVQYTCNQTPESDQINLYLYTLFFINQGFGQFIDTLI